MKNCNGFDNIQLENIVTDKFDKPKKISKENFEKYEYSYAKLCFIYFRSLSTDWKVLHKVRLDNLLTRKCFPHVFIDSTEMSDASDSNNEDHAPSQNAINNARYLSKVKEIHDFMYSFKPKQCSTCNNK